MENERLSKERAAETRLAVKSTYRAVAKQPEGRFPYPVGRASAEGLGYRAEWLSAVPAEVVERFVGVGNPFRVQRPEAGEHVLDLGCGCGLDVYVAALLVGTKGHSTGLDMTTEMLEWAKRFSGDWSLRNVEFREGTIEALPFENAAFDMVISNGVLNLIPDKDAAFREIRRVLKPDGTFVAADLLVTETIPAEVLANMDAWST